MQLYTQVFPVSLGQSEWTLDERYLFDKHIIANSRPSSMHDFNVKSLITQSDCEPKTN
jgi:hypothetical protein